MTPEPYFTSDWHLEHKRDSKLARRRGFADGFEMNDYIIDTVINNVPKGNTLYNLGDLATRIHAEVLDPYLKRLRHAGIQMQWIYGNHDFKVKYFPKGLISWQGWQKTIKYDGQKIFLNHYPCHVWESSHYGSWHLHGHIHSGDYTDALMRATDLVFPGKIYNVCVDQNNMKPLSFTEVAAIMEKKSDNWDLIKR